MKRSVLAGGNIGPWEMLRGAAVITVLLEIAEIISWAF